MKGDTGEKGGSTASQINMGRNSLKPHPKPVASLQSDFTELK